MMGEKSKIEWTDATVNFWFGCTKVSAACDHCYAEKWAKRSGMVEWGHGKPRRESVSAVKLAYKLDHDSAMAGVGRLRVFTNSLSDFFDAEIPAEFRTTAWNTIRRTPNLEWLLLTKRPHFAINNLPERPLENVRIGVTVEDEKMALARMPHLAGIAAAGWRTFVSYEPALGPVDWTSWLDSVGWLICGGESGPHARPMDLAWARSARDACKAAGVPFFFKQTGGKRKPFPAIPDDLMVREWPASPQRTEEKP